jgi:release factor glutamine methyltransferase
MSSEEPWTVKRILDWTIQYLKEKGSASPRLDAEVLLAHARRCQRIQLYTQFDQPLSDQERATMRELVKRRAAAEPVAYLVGHKEFFSLDFDTPPGVLIPRPDTETLVMAALDVLKTSPSLARGLDLCTGTGCVAIAIAKNHPGIEFTAVEISPQAFEVARANVARHQLESRIDLLSGDLFEPIPEGERFDLIVSNPPYVASGEIGELARDIREHEPHLALDGGPDGLDVIRRIVRESPRRLNPGGWLMLELSPEQAPAAIQLLQENGFTSVTAKNDLSGQARVVVGKWES